MPGCATTKCVSNGERVCVCVCVCDACIMCLKETRETCLFDNCNSWSCIKSPQVDTRGKYIHGTYVCMYTHVRVCVHCSWINLFVLWHSQSRLERVASVAERKQWQLKETTILCIVPEFLKTGLKKPQPAHGPEYQWI